MSKRFDNALMGLKDTYPMPDPRRREEFLNSLPEQEKRRTAVIPFLNGKPIWYAIPAVAVAAVMLTVGIRTYQQNPPHQIPVVETTTTTYTETVTHETLTETVTQVMTETTRQTTQHTSKTIPTTETVPDAFEIVPGTAPTRATSAVTAVSTTAKPATQAAQSPIPARTAAPTRPTDPQESMTHRNPSQTTKTTTKTTKATTHTTIRDPQPDTPLDPVATPTDKATDLHPEPTTQVEQPTTRRTTATTRQTTATTRRTTSTTRRTTEPTTVRTAVRTTAPTTAKPTDPTGQRTSTRMTTVTTTRTTTWMTTITTARTTRTTARTTQTHAATDPTTYWFEWTTTPPETIPIYSTAPTQAPTERPTEAAETTASPTQEGTLKWTEATTDRETEATYTQATESTTQPETYSTVAVYPEYSKDENAPVWTDFSFDYEPDSDQVPIWGSQAETASDIVCGRIVNIRYTRIGVIPYTAIDVEVTNVITGRPKGGTLTVFEPGGYIPLEELAEYDYDISERAASMTADERAQAETVYEKATSLPEPVIGEECLFFLSKDWGGDAFFYSGSPHFCRMKVVQGTNPITADQQQYMVYSGRFRLTPVRIQNFLATGE